MRCAGCQVKITEGKDFWMFDNDGFVYCSAPCRHRGFNLGKFFAEFQRETKGWKHTKLYYNTYETAYYTSSRQEVWNAALAIFNKFDVPISLEGLDFTKDVMRTIHKNKRMTNKQHKVLCIFLANIVENSMQLKLKSA